MIWWNLGRPTVTGRSLEQIVGCRDTKTPYDRRLQYYDTAVQSLDDDRRGSLAVGATCHHAPHRRLTDQAGGLCVRCQAIAWCHKPSNPHNKYLKFTAVEKRRHGLQIDQCIYIYIYISFSVSSARDID